MTRNRGLILLMVFLLGIGCLLTFHLHFEGIKEVLSQFQKGQLSYAIHLSNKIQLYIQARARGLRAAASFPSIQNGSIAKQRLDLEAYAKQIAQVYVKAVSLLDESGTFVYSKCGRRVGIHVNKNRRAAEEARKRGYIDMYLPHIGIALQQILKLSDAERNRTCTDLKAILEKTRKAD